MNKGELISDVATEIGMTKKDCGMVLAAVITSISGALTAGEEVSITGFAKFTPKVKPAGTGRNPSTGEVIDVPEKTVIKIKPGSQLVDAVSV